MSDGNHSKKKIPAHRRIIADAAKYDSILGGSSSSSSSSLQTKSRLSKPALMSKTSTEIGVNSFANGSNQSSANKSKSNSNSSSNSKSNGNGNGKIGSKGISNNDSCDNLNFNVDEEYEASKIQHDTQKERQAEIDSVKDLDRFRY